MPLTSNNYRLVVLLSILLIGGCGGVRTTGESLVLPSADESKNTTAKSASSEKAALDNAFYVSSRGDKLTAIYHNNFNLVEVHLPDGRITRLPRAYSNSGARFSDGGETFWAFNDEGAYWLINRRIFHGSLVR